MPTPRLLVLTPAQQQELEHLRDHHPKPYCRERAAALLKIAAGSPAAVVARTGLLKARQPDTVYTWLNRFEQEGCASLTVRRGRGRKPAFSPGAPERRRGERSLAAHRPSGPAATGPGPVAVDAHRTPDHL